MVRESIIFPGGGSYEGGFHHGRYEGHGVVITTMAAPTRGSSRAAAPRERVPRLGRTAKNMSENSRKGGEKGKARGRLRTVASRAEHGGTICCMARP